VETEKLYHSLGVTAKHFDQSSLAKLGAALLELH
jgi:hypothetical protein